MCKILSMSILLTRKNTYQSKRGSTGWRNQVFVATPSISLRTFSQGAGVDPIGHRPLKDGWVSAYEEAYDWSCGFPDLRGKICVPVSVVHCRLFLLVVSFTISNLHPQTLYISHCRWTKWGENLTLCLSTSKLFNFSTFPSWSPLGTHCIAKPEN